MEWNHTDPRLLRRGTVRLEKPAYQSQLNAVKIAAESAIGQSAIADAFETFTYGAERHSFRLSVLSAKRRRQILGERRVEPRQVLRVEVHIPLEKQEEVRRRLQEQEFVFINHRGFEPRRKLRGFPGVFFFKTGPQGHSTLELDVVLKSWDPATRHTVEDGVRQAHELLDAFFSTHEDTKNIRLRRNGRVEPDQRELLIGYEHVKEAIEKGMSATITDSPEGSVAITTDFEPDAHAMERAYQLERAQTVKFRTADEVFGPMEDHYSKLSRLSRRKETRRHDRRPGSPRNRPR